MSKRILVVEDHPVNRRLVETILRRAGFQVGLAVDGEKAVAWLAETRPDLIIMDLMMPVMDGYEALAHIRAEPDLVDLPVIAVTADASVGIQQRVAQAGFDAYLAKPFAKEAILDLINGLLQADPADTDAL